MNLENGLGLGTQGPCTDVMTFVTVSSVIAFVHVQDLEARGMKMSWNVEALDTVMFQKPSMAFSKQEFLPLD